MRKGQEQLRVLMGGKGSGGTVAAAERAAETRASRAAPSSWLGLPLLVCGCSHPFYTVKPEEQSVELFLGEFNEIGTNGLNFAPWPFVTYEKFNVTTNRTESLGLNDSRDSGWA
jgi:membrane protease subunit HflK